MTFDCFVISLEREPQRLRGFRERNAVVGLPTQHFAAVDGLQLTSEQITQVVAPGSTNYTRGAVGAALSHLALWKRCIASDRPQMIFEDDALLRRDMVAQLSNVFAQESDWDIVLFGYNTDVPIELNLSPGLDLLGTFTAPYPTAPELAAFVTSTSPVRLQRLVSALGICGYAIAPKGARMLSECCVPMDNRPVRVRGENRSFPAYGIDCMMANMYPSIQAYACVPPLVMTPNDKSTSTTWPRG